MYKRENEVSLISPSPMLEEAKIMFRSYKPRVESGGDAYEVLVISLFPDTPGSLKKYFHEHGLVRIDGCVAYPL